jgi:hypothetical protein
MYRDLKKNSIPPPPLPFNNKKIKNQGAPFQVPPLHDETSNSPDPVKNN